MWQLTLGRRLFNDNYGARGVRCWRFTSNDVSQVDGDIQLDGTVKEGDKVAFTLGSTNIEVTAYNSSKKDLASLLSTAINESAAGHVASVNSDGSISVSKDTASANIMSAEAAAVAIQNIDAAVKNSYKMSQL